MAIVRAQVAIQSKSGMPKDVITNRFHFNTPTTPPSAAEVTEILDRCTDFYIEANSGTSRMSEYFGQQVAQNGHTVKLYNMADPEPRVPIGESTFNLPANPASASLPDEVAVVLSFQADAVSGVPQARRRNRIYFGPLETSAATFTGNEVRPTSGLIADLILSAEEFLGRTTINVLWTTRSETAGTTAVVDNGWVDDSFDTQRRRGVAASTRTTFTL